MSDTILGPQQQAALDDAFNGLNLFVCGAAGCGKSHVTREITDGLRLLGKTVAVCGSTGMAAVNVSGLTIHSCLGTGMSRNRAEAQKRISSDSLSKATDRLSEIDTIVVDEVSMLTGDYITMMDWWLRLTRQKQDEPFGGVQVVFVGDPLQLPPVVKPEDKVEHKYFFESPAWVAGSVTTHLLTKNYRQSGDSDFRRHLLRIRKGAAPEDTLAFFNARVAADVGGVATKLRPTNAEADSINDAELDAIPAPVWRAKADFSGNEKWIEGLKKSMPCDEELRLKEGAEVRVIRNNFNQGYVNGSRGVVESCSDSAVMVRLRSGTLVQITRATWEIKNAKDTVLAAVKQFPLRLAYACTVHASQGMTLDELEFGPDRTFGHAMAYVALSRVRTIEGLRLTAPIRREHIRASGRVVDWCRAQRDLQAARLNT